MSLVRTGELLRLVAGLASEGIPVIPFKGPTLAVAAYGQTGLREFADLDLLVRPEDAAASQRLLLAQGYLPQLPANPTQEEALLRFDCERQFRRAVDNEVVEIHWEFNPPYLGMQLDLGGMWSRLTTVSLAGTEVPALADEDLFLVLATHAHRHSWGRLGWVTDIAELLRSRPLLNWPVLLQRAYDAHVLRIVQLAAVLSHRILDAPVPKWVVSGAAGATELCDQLFQGFTSGEGGPVSLLAYLRYYLRSRERGRDRATFLFRRLLTPSTEDWRLLPLPGRLFPLYYAAHPVLLAASHVPGMRTRIWPDGASPVAGQAPVAGGRAGM